jgi:uncharacterized membrane protein
VDDPGTTRLETFSDGVFAIAATVIVLEIGVGEGNGHELGHALVHIWPSYLAYVTSFATIGIIWMNHHHTVSLMARSDRTHQFLNVLLLMTIAFLPFPTKLVADFLHRPGAGPATLAYASTFVIMAALHMVWWQYARRGRRLIAEGVSDDELRAVDRAYAPGVLVYMVALVVTFASPLAAVLITFGIAAFYLPSAALFDRGREPR